MFSNKTGTLMEKIDVYQKFGRKRVLIIKPTTDTRSGQNKIKNFHGRTMVAEDVPANKPEKIFRIISRKEAEQGRRFDVIAFDEVQFFKADSGFFQVVDRLLDLGYDILAAGLMLNFRREPYGSTLQLFGLVKNLGEIILLHSYCKQCGQPAFLPQRLSDGKPSDYREPENKPGGAESYEARCYNCHELPNRPVIGK